MSSGPLKRCKKRAGEAELPHGDQLPGLAAEEELEQREPTYIECAILLDASSGEAAAHQVHHGQALHHLRLMSSYLAPPGNERWRAVLR